MTTKLRKPRIYTCHVSGCTEPAKNIGYSCEKHQAEHRAMWKEEHTRKPGDTRKCWLIGDECLVTIGKITYEAKILDMSDVSRREHDHDLMMLELTRTLKGWDGKPITNTWIHPEPVQSYKLRKPLLKGEV